MATKDIYDTEQFSHFNVGHTYGDSLTDDQRRALIEYLKTLRHPRPGLARARAAG